MTGQVEKAIDKIRKLLAMANDNADGGEHERDNALRQAMAMLAKHNLTMADLEDDLDKEDRDCFVIDEEFPEPFRRVIGSAVSRLFFCEFFSMHVPGKQKYKFHFVGLESNAQTALEMTKYLIASVSREGQRRRKELNESVGWDTTFRNAAASQISKRCDELRAKADEEHNADGSNALVLASLYEQEAKLNDDYISKVLGLEIKVRTSKGQYKNREAVRQGMDYGNKVNLNRQIASKAPTTPTLALPA